MSHTSTVGGRSRSALSYLSRNFIKFDHNISDFTSQLFASFLRDIVPIVSHGP